MTDPSQNEPHTPPSPEGAPTVDPTRIPTAAVAAAWRVLWAEGVDSAYRARCRDYPDPAALREADEEAERMNDDLMRRALAAAAAAGWTP